MIKVYRIRYHLSNGRDLGRYTKNVEARTPDEAIALFHFLAPDLGLCRHIIARRDHYATPTATN
jgi:hypothetical protein